MDFKKYNKSYFDVINERFSCRTFEARKITTEEISYILEAARLSPTACNNQPEVVYVVENEALLEKMHEATRFTFDAKTIFVICYDKELSWKRRRDERDYGVVDATIVATQMMLAATALNLGTCYVCSFKEEMIREILGIPANLDIVSLLPVGYPKDINPHNTRKDLEDIVIYK